MITEFIDGLQQFLLQNALITAIAIGIVAGAVDASSFCEACPSWESYLARGPSCVALSFILASISLSAPLSLDFSFHPYHLYQEQTPSSRATLRSELPFLLPRLR